MSKLLRSTWVDINLNRLKKNYNELKKMQPGLEIIAVVKANAYGHGVIKVVTALIQEGVNFFAVSSVEEGIEIRAVYNNVDILVMGPSTPNSWYEARNNDLIITLYDDQSITKALEEDFLRVHLNVDTGMSRLGVNFKKASYWMQVLKEANNISFEGLYTHFSSSEEGDNYFRNQRYLFTEICKDPNTPSVVHSDNTGAWTLEKAPKYLTHGRLGLGIYGYKHYSSKVLPVLSWHTKIVSLKKLDIGDCVGYGHTYCSTEKEVIAIIPVGYADGLLRFHQNQIVLIKDKPFKIVGRISMDQTIIKVDSSIKINDEVIILGDGNDAKALANRINTISYEILCSISYRVPRFYKK